MRILWITNITFPEAETLIQGGKGLKGSGGWLLGAAEMLAHQPGMELTVASVSRSVSSLSFVKGEKINYVILPFGKGNHVENHDYEPLWREVYSKVRPDVIHIHGTEYSHQLAYLEACGTEHVCVSIQGLVSACSHYFHYGISKQEIIFSITPYSVLYGGVSSEQKDFERRGECEKKIILKARHIIGRTSWDRDRVWAINPNTEYHHCNETLRSEFYKSDTWKYDACTPYSIFLSQGSSPFKGLHMVLRALPLVLRHYPDAIVRIAGSDISSCKSLKQRLKMSDYGNYIRKLIKKYNLRDSVFFTGPLDAEEMRNEYLKCNVFICPSAIENSPNSLGEAQLLGVPVLASYSGGVPDMMSGAEEQMYRFEETDILGGKICKLFEQRGDVNTSFLRNSALERHDPQKNLNDLLEIYKKL